MANEKELELHVKAIAKIAGVALTSQKFRELERNENHPDRKRLEAIGGEMFSKSGRLKGLLAVTSLANLSHHHKKQPIALRSWKNHGLEIACVNTKDEIRDLQPRYPQVTHWIESGDEATSYARPSQRINTLLDVATNRNTAILLMNSDIAIHGNQDILIDKLKRRKTTIGIRHNYEKTIDAAKIEPCGLDAFLIFPEVVKTVPKAPYAIGRPFWDYWLPWVLMRDGHDLDWIGEPLFFHEMHPLNWNQGDWVLGRDWFEKKYGERIHWAAWRESMPFPPPKNTYTGDKDVVQLRMSIGRQTYRKDKLEVIWNPQACRHCEKCYAGLPEVFKPFESPWVQLGGAANDRIAELVRQCPTGALSVAE